MNSRFTHHSKRLACALQMLSAAAALASLLCHPTLKIQSYNSGLPRSNKHPQPIRQPSLITPGKSSRP